MKNGWPKACPFNAPGVQNRGEALRRLWRTPDKARFRNLGSGVLEAVSKPQIASKDKAWAEAKTQHT
jgi:hypothetical protein